jgi:Zn-dependent metalloprotease
MNKMYVFCLMAMLYVPICSKAQGKLLETKDPSIARIESNRKTDAPFSILFKEEATYKLNDAETIFTKYLGLRANTDELRFTKSDNSNHITVSHFQQYFKGIKVEHGSYAVTAKDGKISFISGDFYTVNTTTNTTASLTESDALSKALSYMHASTYKWQIPAEETFIKTETSSPLATYYPKGELVLVEDFMQDGLLSGKVSLAYKFNIYAQEPLNRTNVFVDAVSGKILLDNAIIKHHNNNKNKPETKAFQNIKNISCEENKLTSAFASGTAVTKYSGSVTIPTRLVGANYNLISSIAGEAYPLHTLNMRKGTNYGTATEFADNNNNWTAAEFNNVNFDDVALDAHWGAAKVFDYWKNVHNRSSYDGAGAVINSYVHYSTAYDNAYWDGVEMTYGDGSQVTGGFLPLAALDVCGHEIGHAVCDFVVGGVGLTYNRESGAMNEGFSDIWGAAIEHYSDLHEIDAVAKSYFDIGEEIGLPLPTPLRSMSNPNLFSQPDTYLGTSWVDATVAGCPTPNSNTNDNCGVHTNSGVLNHWFYLLVSGGTGINDIASTFAVPGIGWADAEHIAFLGEQNLSATSNYAACRTAMINASTTLFGACSLQTEAVTRAWYAVGVGANFIPCAAQIGFKDVLINVSENAGIFTCPATKTATVRMMVEGPVPTGGNASITVTATGTAANGQDFTIGTGTATFVAGSAADQNIILNIVDDAAVEGNENITLDFTVTANSSTATKSNAYKQAIINIIDNDTIPETGSNLLNSTVNSFNTTTNNTSAFRSAARTSRSQFLWTAAELTAAGVLPNVPISAISFEMLTKNSTIPFTGYTISFANTAITAMTAYVAAASLTQAYTGNYTTTTGKNTITLTTPFNWNGTSNLVMQACFTNATAGTANDAIQGYTGAGATATAYTGYVTGTTSGCALTGITTSATKPLITFTQTKPATAVETASAATRSQQTVAGTNSYFYSSANKKIIAAVTNNSNDLGCVTASVTAAGTTFTALPVGFSGANRSSKEISITPTSNAATTNYNATVYFTDAELAGKAPATLLLVKTNAATDALMDASNTKMVTPIVITGTNYKGFTANFTGFSRFFLIDKPATVLPISGLVIEASLQNNQALIKWKTASENNSAFFVVERSYDGINFTEIKQTLAAGNSSSEKTYSLLDKEVVKNIHYYRVKLINTDGSNMYSAIVSVRINTKESMLVISPNPVQEIFMIQYNNASNKTINIVDATGRKIAEVSTFGTSGSISVDASNYAAGIYMAVFTDKNNNTITQKFIKQ